MTGMRVLICLAAAFAAAGLSVAVFNAVPAGWLCDYGEQPGAELSGKRLLWKPHGIVMVLILAAAFISLYQQYRNSFYFYVCCIIAIVLLLTGTADLKYRIIPDQFVLALLPPVLALDCFDLIVKNRALHSGWVSPVLGAAASAGLMLAMGLFGRLAYQKEALGFGDVKLFSAVGLLAGFPYVFLLFLMTILLAFFHIVLLLIRRKILKNLYLPLGPYICLATLLFLAFHSQISSFAGWYLSLLNL